MVRRLGRYSVVAAVALAGIGCQAKAAGESATFQGTVEFDDRVLGFQLGGRVATVGVVRGDVVRAGQLLATLDDSLTRAERAARAHDAAYARAQLELLRAGTRAEDIRSMRARVRGARADESELGRRRARKEFLLETSAVPPAEFDRVDARWRAAVAHRQSLAQQLAARVHGPRPEKIKAAAAKLAAAEQAVALQQDRLERHRLHAPIAGAVLDVHVDPGEVVVAGSPVVTVADISYPYADVFVPQGDLEGIEVGVKASVVVDASKRKFAGHVEDVARRTEFTPRYLFSEQERPNLVVRVRVRIHDPDHRLHAGVPAFARIERRRGQRAVSAR